MARLFWNNSVHSMKRWKFLWKHEKKNYFKVSQWIIYITCHTHNKYRWIDFFILWFFSLSKHTHHFLSNFCDDKYWFYSNLTHTHTLNSNSYLIQWKKIVEKEVEWKKMLFPYEEKEANEKKNLYKPNGRTQIKHTTHRYRTKKNYKISTLFYKYLSWRRNSFDPTSFTFFDLLKFYFTIQRVRTYLAFELHENAHWLKQQQQQKKNTKKNEIIITSI